MSLRVLLPHRTLHWLGIWRWNVTAAPLFMFLPQIFFFFFFTILTIWTHRHQK